MAEDDQVLHKLLLTTAEVKLLAQALAVAAMDDLTGDTGALDSSRAARIVWAHAHAVGASDFRRALGPLATVLAELDPNRMPEPGGPVDGFECFAWIGEDEYGSGVIGLKRGITPAGDIPLVSIDLEKIIREELVDQMRSVVDYSGKTRYLVRLVFAGVEAQIEPQGKSDG